MSLNLSSLLTRGKAVAAVVYSVLTVLAATTLPDPVNKWVALAVLVVGPLVVHQVPNAVVEKPAEVPTPPPV